MCVVKILGGGSTTSGAHMLEEIFKKVGKINELTMMNMDHTRLMNTDHIDGIQPSRRNLRLSWPYGSWGNLDVIWKQLQLVSHEEDDGYPK